MTHVGDEKPSLEDLKHYGVLGMKWGQRKTASGKEILAARRRLAKDQQHRLGQMDKLLDTKRGSKERKSAEKKLADMYASFLKDPDRVIAARMTRGEKFAALIIGGPIGLAGIAATSAHSRRIEAKQDAKAYK